MVENIEVGYTQAAFVGGLGIYHKYILYTNSAGEQFYARGGPGFFGPGALDGGLDESSTSPAGNIKTKDGEYVRGTPDWDNSGADPSVTPHTRETITTGDDLSAKWEAIKEVMRGVDLRDIPYDPKDTNSNAAVDEALRGAMGRAGRELAERNFSIESVVDAHLKIYRSLTCGGI